MKPATKLITLASIGTVVAGSLLACMVVFMPAEVRAEAAASDKADRLTSVARGSACSLQGWPNYEQECQFDMRRPADDTRTVRVISLR